MHLTMCPETPGRFASFAKARADAYLMLAALLERPPTEELLGMVRSLEWDETLPESLDAALKALRRAARDTTCHSAGEEFDKLFVGLGSGEVVPYASWYRDRRLHSRPLASLRSALRQLGIVRREGVRESEDHAGCLCEIMALIAGTNDPTPLAAQEGFFREHLSSWMTAFFGDLGSAKSAVFYRTVAHFAGSFLETENEYLACASNTTPAARGGSHHEK